MPLFLGHINKDKACEGYGNSTPHSQIWKSFAVIISYLRIFFNFSFLANRQKSNLRHLQLSSVLGVAQLAH